MRNANYISAINRMRKEKNAIILAHYYQTADIQDIADFVGDSLALAQKAAYNKADIILFAGVKFMAETAKIICPEKKILLPDIDAGCSLADSCTADELKKFIAENPGRTVVAYINSTTEIKAMADIICTSANAVHVIESLPENEKILFVPDRNLGSYIREKTGRDIVVWEGACHVHENFSAEGILRLKKENPEAEILVHPECESAVRELADYIGSTAGMLEYTSGNKNKAYIVATEPGIIHQMKLRRADAKYLAAPRKDFPFAANDCNFMKTITIEKIYNCLKYEEPVIRLDPVIINSARTAVERMLDISKIFAGSR